MIYINNREYILNKLIMNRLRFILYKLSLYFKNLKERINTKKTYTGKYYEIITGWNSFGFVYYSSTHKDKGRLYIQFIYLSLFLYLSPSSNYPKSEMNYGFSYYTCSPSIFLYYGKKYKIVNMPWIHVWIRTSVLLKDNTWIHDTMKDRKEFWKPEWVEQFYSETHNYTYISDDNSPNVVATITVQEIEWRRKWSKWVKILPKINKYIEVEFSTGIGGRSIDGGVMGKSWEMLKNETPIQALRRMERDYRC